MNARFLGQTRLLALLFTSALACPSLAQARCTRSGYEEIRAVLNHWIMLSPQQTLPASAWQTLIETICNELPDSLSPETLAQLFQTWTQALRDQIQGPAGRAPSRLIPTDTWDALVRGGQNLSSSTLLRQAQMAEQFPVEALAEVRRSIDPEVFAALYPNCSLRVRPPTIPAGSPSSEASLWDLPGLRGTAAMLGIAGDPVTALGLPAETRALLPATLATGTDSEANSGLVMRAYQTIREDPNFAQSALRFYSRILHRDSSRDDLPPHGSYVPMNTRAERPDWYAHALRETGDPRQALELLFLFGHDADAHRLPEDGSCVVSFLNAVNARTGSSLFVPGALAGLDYSESWRAGARAIESACLPPFPAALAALQPLCNDGESEYLADYYHVITGAFMGCEASVAEEHVPAATRLAERTYLLGPVLYKIARFEEAYDRIASPNPAATWLRGRFDAMVERIFLNLLSHDDPLAGGLDAFAIDATEIRAAGLPLEYLAPLNAILRRQAFEIGFRHHQHQMGFEFGASQCASAPPDSAHRADARATTTRIRSLAEGGAPTFGGTHPAIRAGSTH